jgi:hypothetical protein
VETYGRRITAAERDVARIDIAFGPTVPGPGQKKALVSGWHQRQGRVGDYEVLFSLLPGAGARPWNEQHRAGHGLLCVLSDSYVAALAALARAAKLRPRGDLTVLDIVLEISERWRERLDGTPEHRNSYELAVSGAAHEALLGMDRGQKVYAWFGPGVPWVLSPRAKEKLVARMGAGSRDIARR